ncbi:hypothetical protein ACP70R_015103 [Stipagrostis hirtigluma subsp. patula]
MSTQKRKMEEVGEQILWVAVSDMVSRIVSAALAKLSEPTDVGDQVERLDTLVTMVRSAVEAAEGAHIRNWWLRRWLWKLRDAACEGDAALRAFRRREAEERGPWWRRLLRSPASGGLLFFRDGGGAATLRREVGRLEEVAAGIGDFLKLLDMETRVPEPASTEDEWPMFRVVDRQRRALLEPPPRSPEPAARSRRRRVSPEDYDDALASVDDKMESLSFLVFMVRSAVDQAERVDIRSLWLLRWLRDAALDGDEVLQSFRQRRAPEKSSSGTTLWDAAKRVLGAAKAMLQFAGDDAADRLARTLARSEMVSSGLDDFRKLLDMETMKPQAAPPSVDDEYDHGAMEEQLSATAKHASSFMEPEDVMGRSRGLGKPWLSEWRRRLLAVALSDDPVLLATPASSPAEAIVARRTAQSVEAAAAHLGEFATLVRFAVGGNCILAR